MSLTHYHQLMLIRDAFVFLNLRVSTILDRQQCIYFIH